MSFLKSDVFLVILSKLPSVRRFVGKLLVPDSHDFYVDKGVTCGAIYQKTVL
jgi:hypothetical protein